MTKPIILALALTFASLGHAQTSTFTYNVPQTDPTKCVSAPTGTSVCPVIQADGSVTVGFAANGGKFTFYPGPPAGAPPIGSTFKVNITCPKGGTGNINAGFSSKGCPVTVTN